MLTKMFGRVRIREVLYCCHDEIFFMKKFLTELEFEYTL